MKTIDLWVAVRSLIKTGFFTKADVGLDQADNTTDADKPVSDATQAELNNLSSSIPTTEQIQDIVAAMITGGTHIGVTPTYTDNGENDGFINLDTTPPVTLQPLTLSANTFTEGDTAGTVIGAIQNTTSGSSLDVSPSDTLAIDGSNNLIVGLTPATAGTINATITETLAGASNTPNDSSVSVTVSSATQPLTVATILNPPNTAVLSRSLPNYYSRSDHKIGSVDRNSIVFSFSNNYLTNTNGGASFSNNRMTITEAHFEYAGATHQITFNSSNSLVLESGDVNIHCDEILPADLSVTEFAVGQVGWVKLLIQLDNATDSVPYSDVRHRDRLTGRQVGYYDPANTTLSNVSQPGEVVITGTTPQSAAGLYAPICLGRAVDTTGKMLFTAGDSIPRGGGDSGGSALPDGYGYAQRMLQTLQNDTITAGLTFAVSGARAELLAVTQLEEFYQYATDGLISFGTNDFGAGVTASQMATRINSAITQMKTDGINNVGIVLPPPRATTTDQFATTANQTPFADFDDVSDESTIYIDTNDTLITNKDFTIDNDVVRDGVDRFKWAVDGTAQHATGDGTHPSGNAGGHPAIAAAAQTVVRAAIGL